MAIFLTGVFTTVQAQSDKTDLFVAPNGNDAWSGGLPSPNSAKSDGPFATVQRAVLAARALRQKNDHRAHPIRIQLRGGVYAISQPIILLPEDSGTTLSPTQFTAFPNEKPFISGGVRITKWKVGADGRWRSFLPEVKSGAWNFNQLYVNETRRCRPRLPKVGTYYISKQLEPTAASVGKGYDQFGFKKNEIKSAWQNIHDVEAICFQNWTAARLRLDKVDEDKQVVKFTGHTGGQVEYLGLGQGKRYFLENVKEALSIPGEWYLDRPTGELTYLPMKGETPKNTTVTAPKSERLLEFRGDPEKHKWVENILFDGIGFGDTNWTTPPEGNNFPQAEVNISATITALGGRDLTFSNCTIVNTGNYGVSLKEGSKRCVIESCILSNLGAGGVMIGEQGMFPDEERRATNNVVQNCLIEHGGRVHPAAIGVWIWQSSYNVIKNNSIHDLYYTGISVGWTWGYGESQANHNLIESNDIWKIGQNVLSDMGGIYTLGVAPGTILRGNVIHDTSSVDYGGWGIYPDEGSTGLLIENNLVYNTKTGSFHQHYGKDNLVRNNIFAYSKEAQLIRTRAEDHRSFRLERNIILWKSGPLLGSNWTGNNYELDNNLYWRTDGKPVDFAGLSLDEWRKKGQDLHSLIADPGFAEPELGMFSLSPDSPAFKLGFKEFNYHAAGSSIRSTLQDPERAFPEAVERKVVVNDDFESTDVGSKAEVATTNEENSDATVRVTDEFANSGKRSLKFIDKAGQKFGFNPHIFYAPNFDKGVAVGKFALRWEAGARMYNEWRGDGTPYSVGPSILIDEDGALKANGKEVVRIPAGKWVRFEIRFALGDAGNGSYDLTVILPGRTPPILVNAVPCNPQCKAIRWFGFVADGNKDAVFYLDDVSLKLKSN